MPTAAEQPQPAPEPPSPRRLLCAAQLIAQGEAPGITATMAGLSPAALRSLRDDPDFEALVEECRAVEAMPRADQDERLLRLVRRAVERALADGRLGAIPSALRLLGLLPTRAPSGGGEGTPRRDRSPRDDAAPDPPPELAAAAEARWGMAPDGDGGWVGPDGLPAMPGRLVEVVEAPGGPARVLDRDDLEPGAAAELVATLDGVDDAAVEEFNRAGDPWGGSRWDRVTRTLWRWEGPDSDQPAPAPAPPREPDLLGGDATAPEPGPVPAPPPPPYPLDLLRARLDRLLATGEIPKAPDDLDLAEAVCSLLWPKWPRYQGKLNLTDVRLALGGGTIDERALARLGGADAGSRFPTEPPPRKPARDSPPPPPPAVTRHARERPPNALRQPERPRLEFSREHGLHLKHLGPWRG